MVIRIHYATHEIRSYRIIGSHMPRSSRAVSLSLSLLSAASPLPFRGSLSNRLSHRRLVLSFFFAFFFLVFNFISPFFHYSSICFHASVTPFVRLTIPYLDSIPLTPPISPTIPYHSFIFPFHYFPIFFLLPTFAATFSPSLFTTPYCLFPLSTRSPIMHVRKW